MARRITIALLLAMAGALALANVAEASFTSNGSGSGYAAAKSLGPGNTPTVTVSGRNVTVSWTATTSGSAPVTGYTVKRYNTTGTAQTIKSSCTGTITALTCTENAVPSGTWLYSVTPISGTNWKGTESAQSASVTVGSPVASLSPSTVTSLPQTLTGSVTNFISGETVTYRLDTTTGTVLSGSISPSPVPNSGTATATVTLPSGTTNGSHKIYAIGSAGDSVYATITVSVPRTVTTSAWDLRDASTGTEVNVSDPFAAASDGLVATTVPYGASFAANRYDDADFNGPLRPGVAVTSATLNVRIAAPSSSSTACFYVELRDQTDDTLLETDGSQASPYCVTGTTQTTTSIPLSSVTTTSIANDLTARVFGRVTGGGSFTSDQATITVVSADGTSTLYENSTGGTASGSPYNAPWTLYAQDNQAYTSSTPFATSYSTTKYVKYTFPSYVPTGATNISATLIHAYRGSTAGICTYLGIYSGSTSIATKGSSSSNLSCSTSTSSDQVDTVSIPEIDTTTEANNAVVRVYAKSSGATTSLVSDQAKLQITYVKAGDAP